MRWKIVIQSWIFTLIFLFFRRWKENFRADIPDFERKIFFFCNSPTHTHIRERMIRLFTGNFHCQGWCCAIFATRSDFISFTESINWTIDAMSIKVLDDIKLILSFANFSARRFHHFHSFGSKNFSCMRCDCARRCEFKDQRKIFGVFIHKFGAFLELDFRLGSVPKFWSVFLTKHPEMAKSAPKLSNAVHPRSKSNFLGCDRIFFVESQFARWESAASSIFLFRILRSGSFLLNECFGNVSSAFSTIFLLTSMNLFIQRWKEKLSLRKFTSS